MEGKNNEKDQVIDESDEETEDEDEEVQLGFALKGRVNSLFDSPNWRKWDGGVVGGKPIWLNPRDIPQPDRLVCRECEEPMTFLLQIYCPLDEPVEAFHRSLYLFCCRKAKCVQRGSIKCFRCQMPKENSFYPSALPTKNLSEEEEEIERKDEGESQYTITTADNRKMPIPKSISVTRASTVSSNPVYLCHVCG